MSASPIINGLMVFFSATTVAVIAYPIIKLLPSWLERSVYRKAVFHRDAIAALDLAISRNTANPAHRARLQAQADFHRRRWRRSLRMTRCSLPRNPSGSTPPPDLRRGSTRQE